MCRSLEANLASKRLAAFPVERTSKVPRSRADTPACCVSQATFHNQKVFATQNPANKQEVFADDALAALTGERRFKAFGFMKLFSKHILEAA